MTNVLLKGNYSLKEGNGIYFNSLDTATLTNVTINCNRADDVDNIGGGGGIYTAKKEMDISIDSSEIFAAQM